MYKQSPTTINYNKFSNLRAWCKVKNKIGYNIFIRKTQNSITCNPKSFWRYVKSKRSILTHFQTLCTTTMIIFPVVIILPTVLHNTF